MNKFKIEITAAISAIITLAICYGMLQSKNIVFIIITFVFLCPSMFIYDFFSRHGTAGSYGYFFWLVSFVQFFLIYWVGLRFVGKKTILKRIRLVIGF